MTPKKIFEIYNGMDCQDYLYKLRTKGIEAAISLKPSASGWGEFRDENDNFLSESDLDIVKDYSFAFEELKTEAEKLLMAFCYELTVGSDLFTLLEDVFHGYISSEDYGKFHKLYDDFDTGIYGVDEIKNLNELFLSKDEENKKVAFAILGL